MASAEEMFGEAVRLQQAGRPAEAEGICRRLLGERPGDAGVMQLLGMIAYQTGRGEEAAGWLREAIRIAPGVAQLHNALGVVLEGSGKREEAVGCYRETVRLVPDSAVAMNNLGAVLVALGRNDEAVEVLRRAVGMRPGHVQAMYNLGVGLGARGEEAEAARCYATVIEAEPGHLAAYVNLGMVHKTAGRLEEARGCFERSVEIDGRSFEGRYNLGITLRKLGRTAEAVAHLREAVAIRPGDGEAHGDLAEALRAAGQIREAMGHYVRGLELTPGRAERWVNFAAAQLALAEFDEAVRASRRALEIDPRCEAATVNLSVAYVGLGRTVEGMELLEALARDGTKNEAAWSGLLMGMRYLAGVPEEEIVARHVEWAGRAENVKSPRWGIDRAKKRLRVGYLSPDLRRHPVGYFTLPILEGRDREGFEVFCYAYEQLHDDVTERLIRAADQWRNVTDWSAGDVAERIRQDGVDILVDLAGHTNTSQLDVMRRRPAPVQVSYLGYPGTTGMSEIDYYVADEFTAPSGEERYFVERLARLPHCFCCYSPLPGAPEVAGSSAERTGRVTFGSLHSLAKVNDRVLDLWARVLKAVPGSRLLMVRQSLRGEARERLAGKLVERGIDAGRFELRGEFENLRHLDIYGEIDVGLDVFPFGGHTTACEAMWMGVPTVTLLGEHHAGRMVGSVLRAAGLEQFVAHTEEEYVSIATRAASDVTALAKLRRGMRQRVTESRLCDAAAFGRELGAMYRRMWQDWCGAGATVP